VAQRTFFSRLYQAISRRPLARDVHLVKPVSPEQLDQAIAGRGSVRSK
jgi:hypothetical protein